MWGRGEDLHIICKSALTQPDGEEQYLIATQIRNDVAVVAVAVGVVAVVAVAVAKCVHIPCIYLYVKHMPLCMHLYAECMYL